MSNLYKIASNLVRTYKTILEDKDLESLAGDYLRIMLDHAVSNGSQDLFAFCVSTGDLSEQDYDDMFVVAVSSGRTEMLKTVIGHHPSLNVEVFNVLERKGGYVRYNLNDILSSMRDVEMDWLFDPIKPNRIKIQINVDQFFPELSGDEKCLAEICNMVEIIFKGNGWKMIEPFTFIRNAQKNNPNNT